MSISHAKPGEVIDVRPLRSSLPTTKTTTLVKTSHFEIIRIVMPLGKVIAEHVVPNDIIVQCLEGKLEFKLSAETKCLAAGQLFYLEANQLHTVRSVENASFLLTIVFPRFAAEAGASS